MIGKKYIYKIYDHDGTYLTTWKDATVPSFSYKINSGLSELTVKLARQFFDFGEGFDVNIGNELKLFVSDAESPDGVQIYDGELSKYRLSMSETEDVEVTFIGYANQLAKRIVINGAGETSITYPSQDPTDVIKDVIDLVGEKITYSTASMDDTGVSVSYDVIQNTALEVVNRMIEIAPKNWYWYIDRSNLLQMHEWNFDDPLKLYIGKHINKLELTKTGESMVNRYYFLGGGSPQLYTKTDRTTSQNEYGVKDTREQDERVTVTATAANRATSFLDENDHPLMSVMVTVIDSNIDPVNGVDIEQLEPGQAVQVLHPEVAVTTSKWDSIVWDLDVWDYNIKTALGQPLRIEQIDYFGTGATLYLSKILDTQAQAINKNTIQLETFRGKDAPTSPA